MSEFTKHREVPFFLKAVLSWFVTSVALLLAAAAVFSFGALPLSGMGYASSLISFLSAFAAAALAIRQQGGRWLIRGGIVAVTLTALLLLAGFLARGELDRGAVLSTVGFTVSGALAGAFAFGAKKARRSRIAGRIGKGRGRK